MNEQAMQGIRAVTFDFFQTLAYHRSGDGGRGRALVEYLTSRGMRPKPWRHQVLYDVLEPHAREYSPGLSPSDKEAYFVRVARRVFECLEIPVGSDEPAEHAGRIWELIGPRSLEIFPDVIRTLSVLRRTGYRLAVISNWQCGLGHFCAELGVGEFFDYIFTSAEIGHEKPDRRIFRTAVDRLGIPPDRIMHVGDSAIDDFDGARAAGMQAVLIDRGGMQAVADRPVIRSLDEVLALVQA